MNQTVDPTTVPADQPLTDPVCGMTLDSAKLTESLSYEGAKYFFCSTGCRAKFEAEPKKYSGKLADGEPAESTPQIKPAPPGAVYTDPKLLDVAGAICLTGQARAVSLIA